MGVYKAKEGKTKDGRIWFFKLRYQDMDVEISNISQENMQQKKKLNLNLD